MANWFEKLVAQPAKNAAKTAIQKLTPAQPAQQPPAVTPAATVPSVKPKVKAAVTPQKTVWQATDAIPGFQDYAARENEQGNLVWGQPGFAEQQGERVLQPAGESAIGFITGTTDKMYDAEMALGKTLYPAAKATYDYSIKPAAQATAGVAAAPFVAAGKSLGVIGSGVEKLGESINTYGVGTIAKGLEAIPGYKEVINYGKQKITPETMQGFFSGATAAAQAATKVATLGPAIGVPNALQDTVNSVYRATEVAEKLQDGILGQMGEGIAKLATKTGILGMGYYVDFVERPMRKTLLPQLFSNVSLLAKVSRGYLEEDDVKESALSAEYMAGGSLNGASDTAKFLANAFVKTIGLPVNIMKTEDAIDYIDYMTGTETRYRQEVALPALAKHVNSKYGTSYTPEEIEAKINERTIFGMNATAFLDTVISYSSSLAEAKIGTALTNPALGTAANKTGAFMQNLSKAVYPTAIGTAALDQAMLSGILGEDKMKGLAEWADANNWDLKQDVAVFTGIAILGTGLKLLGKSVGAIRTLDVTEADKVMREGWAKWNKDPETLKWALDNLKRDLVKNVDDASRKYEKITVEDISRVRQVIQSLPPDVQNSFKNINLSLYLKNLFDGAIGGYAVPATKRLSIDVDTLRTHMKGSRILEGERTLTHEWAHVIEPAVKADPIVGKAWENLIKKVHFTNRGPGGGADASYKYTNPQEYFAEGVSEYLKTPEVLKAEDKGLYDFVETMIVPQFNKVFQLDYEAAFMPRLAGGSPLDSLKDHARQFGDFDTFYKDVLAKEKATGELLPGVKRDVLDSYLKDTIGGVGDVLKDIYRTAQVESPKGGWWATNPVLRSVDKQMTAPKEVDDYDWANKLITTTDPTKPTYNGVPKALVPYAEPLRKFTSMRTWLDALKRNEVEGLPYYKSPIGETQLRLFDHLNKAGGNKYLSAGTFYEEVKKSVWRTDKLKPEGGGDTFDVLKKSDYAMKEHAANRLEMMPRMTDPLFEEARKYGSAEEFVKAQFSKPSYGMSHRPSFEGMPPAHNLLEGGALPRDVYAHPEWSIASGHHFKTDKAAQESWAALQAIKGSPDTEVTVYRASPKNELNSGDWVTFSKTYAAENVEGAEKVFAHKVKAKDVIFAGDDINEFGYYPRAQLTDIWNKANGEFMPRMRGSLRDDLGNDQLWDVGKTSANLKQFRDGLKELSEKQGGIIANTSRMAWKYGVTDIEGLYKIIKKGGEAKLEVDPSVERVADQAAKYDTPEEFAKNYKGGLVIDKEKITHGIQPVYSITTPYGEMLLKQIGVSPKQQVDVGLLNASGETAINGRVHGAIQLNSELIRLNPKRLEEALLHEAVHTIQIPKGEISLEEQLLPYPLRKFEFDARTDSKTRLWDAVTGFWNTVKQEQRQVSVPTKPFDPISFVGKNGEKTDITKLNREEAIETLVKGSLYDPNTAALLYDRSVGWQEVNYMPRMRQLGLDSYGLKGQQQDDLLTTIQDLKLEKYEPKTFEQMKAGAQAKLADPLWFKSLEKGRLTDEDGVALRMMINTHAQFITDAGKRLAESSDPALLRAQMDAADAQLKKAITILVPGKTEQARALVANKIIADKSTDFAYWAQKVAKEMGVDDGTTGALYDKYSATLAMLRTLSDQKDSLGIASLMSGLTESSFVDKLVTLWKAGLLTSPLTHLRNMGSNTAFLTLESIKEIPAASIDQFQALFTGKRTVGLPSLPTMLQSGLPKGLSMANEVMKYGTTLEDLGRSEVYRNTVFSDSMLGKTADKYTKFIFRLLGAEDKAFRGILESASLSSQAKALATNEGLKGKEWQARVSGLVDKPTAEMAAIAREESAYGTFNNENKLSDMVLKAKTAAKGSWAQIPSELVMPFTRTPTNVALRGIDYSPIGLTKGVIETLGNVLHAVAGKEVSFLAQRKAAHDLARGLTGSGIIGVGAYLASKGLMTGTYPTGGDEKKQFKALNLRGGDLRLGDKVYNLMGISPVGNLLQTGAALYNNVKDNGWLKGATITTADYGKGLTEQTFLMGLSNALNALAEPTRYAESVVGGAISGMVPTIIGQLVEAGDKYQRESNSILSRLQARVPGWRQQATPRVDMFGRPMLTNQEQQLGEADGTAAGNLVRYVEKALSRTTDVFFTREVPQHELLTEYERLRVAGVEKAYPPTPGQTGTITITLKDETKQKIAYKMSDEAYSVYMEITGRLMEEAQSNYIKTTEYQALDDEDKAKALYKIYEMARDTSQGLVLPLVLEDEDAFGSSEYKELEKTLTQAQIEEIKVQAKDMGAPNFDTDLLLPRNQRVQDLVFQ